MEENQTKPKVYTEDPFSYNYVALVKSKVNEIPTPAVNSVITDPLYNAVGKSLGIDKPHDWNGLYDKVFTISEWAKERTGSKDPKVILKFIDEALRTIPHLGAKKINDLYIHIGLGIKKGKDE
jgi:hypothetical protein